MRRPQLRRSDLNIEMTPMIDVVFLLLVFFIWTASFQMVEFMLPSAVSVQAGQGQPQTDTPPPEADFENVVVRVYYQNELPSWELNELPVANLNELKSRLQAIADVKQDAPVILHPDPNVPLGAVIDAYDMSRLAGFQQIQFAASEAL